MRRIGRKIFKIRSDCEIANTSIHSNSRYCLNHNYPNDFQGSLIRVEEFMMTEIKTSGDDWKECQPGALSRFAVRHRSRILRRKMILAGGIVSVCLISVLAWNVLLPQTTNSYQEPNYGGIACSKVKKMAKAHLAGSLDSKTSQMIERHLDKCRVCRSFVEQIRNRQASPSKSKLYQVRYVSAFDARHSVP